MELPFLNKNRDRSGDAVYVVLVLILLAGTITIAIAIYYILFAAGAARLANIRHNNLLIAALAFVLSPFYYIYYAFTG